MKILHPMRPPSAQTWQPGGAQINVATHRLLTCIRSFDEAGGWHEQGAQSCAHWLTWRVGLNSGAARDGIGSFESAKVPVSPPRTRLLIPVMKKANAIWRLRNSGGIRSYGSSVNRISIRLSALAMA